MQSRGVDVVFLERLAHKATAPLASPVARGVPLAAAVARFRPDVVHVHWLFTAEARTHELRAVGLPVTVRGHSFDYSVARAEAIAAIPSVKRVWLFPHLAAQVAHPKVAPLTSCFPPTFTPGPPARPRAVLRVIAGVDRKGLEQLIAASKLCPEVPFTIITTRALAPDEDFPERLTAAAPPNMRVLVNLQREEIVTEMHRHSIYAHTKPPHAFGMPVGVGEALASGLHTLVPDVPGAADYVGPAGRTFREPAELAALIHEAVAWSDEAQAAAHARAVAQAERFRADAVLSTVLEEWRRLSGASSG